MSNKLFKKRLYKVIALINLIMILFCKITSLNHFLLVYIEKKLSDFSQLTLKNDYFCSCGVF